ncbi:MAG: hypothetical protein R3Y26_11695 [Rikenellaceae bacterium]
MIQTAGNVKVIYPSSFKIKVDAFTDIDGKELDLAEVQFYIEFMDANSYYTLADTRQLLVDELYVCSFNGVKRVNNIYKDGVLELIFQHYPYFEGPMFYRMKQSFFNEDFTNDMDNVWTSGKLNVVVAPIGESSYSTSELTTTISLAGYKGESGADGTVDFDELTEAQKLTLKGDKGENGTTELMGFEIIDGNLYVSSPEDTNLEFSLGETGELLVQWN